MKRFQANDLRNLVAEVVSAYQAEKRNKWLLESPEVIEEGVFDPGILDTFDYSWSVSGTGIPQNLVTTQDSIEFDAPSDGFVEVSITVNDNDGGDDRVDTLFVGATSNASDVTIAPTSDPDDAPEDVTVTIDNETELISGDFAPGDYIILVGSSDTRP